MPDAPTCTGRRRRCDIVIDADALEAVLGAGAGVLAGRRESFFIYCLEVANGIDFVLLYFIVFLLLYFVVVGVTTGYGIGGFGSLGIIVIALSVITFAVLFWYTALCVGAVIRGGLVRTHRVYASYVRAAYMLGVGVACFSLFWCGLHFCDAKQEETQALFIPASSHFSLPLRAWQARVPTDRAFVLNPLY